MGGRKKLAQLLSYRACSSSAGESIRGLAGGFDALISGCARLTFDLWRVCRIETTLQGHGSCTLHHAGRGHRQAARLGTPLAESCFQTAMIQHTGTVLYRYTGLPVCDMDGSIRDVLAWRFLPCKMQTGAATSHNALSAYRYPPTSIAYRYRLPV